MKLFWYSSPILAKELKRVGLCSLAHLCLHWLYSSPTTLYLTPFGCFLFTFFGTGGGTGGEYKIIIKKVRKQLIHSPICRDFAVKTHVIFCDYRLFTHQSTGGSKKKF